MPIDARNTTTKAPIPRLQVYSLGRVVHWLYKSGMCDTEKHSSTKISNTGYEWNVTQLSSSLLQCQVLTPTLAVTTKCLQVELCRPILCLPECF